MAEIDINQGGNNTFLRKDGFLETVGASDEYRLHKAQQLNFRLAPPYEQRYSDDISFDLTPTGGLGSWSILTELTSDLVSEEDMTATIVEADEQTISYWQYQLAHYIFPEIQFRETLKDRNTTAKIAPLNFKGFLTVLDINELDGIYTLKLEGEIKEYLDFVKT